MKIQGSSFPSIEQLQDQYLKTGRFKDEAPASGGISFQDILSKKTDGMEQPGEVRFTDRKLMSSFSRMEPARMPICWPVCALARNLSSKLLLYCDCCIVVNPFCLYFIYHLKMIVSCFIQ